MRERQTGSRDVSKGTHEGWRSMLRYYKEKKERSGRRRSELRQAGVQQCCTPTGRFCAVTVWSKEQRTAGLRGDGYLAAMASEVTTGLVVSSNVLPGRAVAGDIFSARRRRSLPRSSRLISTISKDMPWPR